MESDDDTWVVGRYPTPQFLTVRNAWTAPVVLTIRPPAAVRMLIPGPGVCPDRGCDVAIEPGTTLVPVLMVARTSVPAGSVVALTSKDQRWEIAVVNR